jgi:putative ATP-dependent endonuclease of the OLD family
MTAYTQAHSYRMRLTRLTIKNFRNLDGVDIPLVGGPVVVGENHVGKSNLVHAIRLVLDSSLSSKARWLRTEDFSEHLGLDPIGDGAEIRISVEIEDFGEDGGLMAALRHAIVSGDPVRRRRVRRLAAPDALERSALRPRAR